MSKKGSLRVRKHLLRPTMPSIVSLNMCWAAVAGYADATFKGELLRDIDEVSAKISLDRARFIADLKDLAGILEGL